MTTLKIDGTEVVLPSNFTCTVKRENSFLTKNGEYTYDATLNLDNPTNKKLYGFLHRLNKNKDITLKRSAVIEADGHVYCNGTEVITGWTNTTVTIQIVSGNSELNYFIGGSLKVSKLTGMGSIDSLTIATEETNVNKCYPDRDYCLPMMCDEASDVDYNCWYSFVPTGMPKLHVSTDSVTYEMRAQPYLCALVRRMIIALGYTIDVNQLDTSMFKNVFIVNLENTLNYYEMLKGWTAQDFLEQVEKICNVVFIVDNTHKSCSIYCAASYYHNSSLQTIQNVSDEYEAEVEDTSDTEEWSTSNITYKFPSSSLYQLDETVLAAQTIKSYADFATLYKDLIANYVQSTTKIGKDSETARTFVRTSDTISKTFSLNGILDMTVTAKIHSANAQGISEVNQFPNINRDTATTDDDDESSTSEMEIDIVPASFAYRIYDVVNGETTADGTFNIVAGLSYKSLATVLNVPANDDSTTDDDSDDEDTYADYLVSATTEESSAIQLYMAMYNGLHQYKGSYMPTSYVDAWHAQNCEAFWQAKTEAYTLSLSDSFVGSLRLQDIESAVYNNEYAIATDKGITIETYDPNMIDVHKIFIINNKRYVCKETEETITATGRNKKWKGTFYPIAITDTDAESRWVLNNGKWNDGGAWLDDGRWIDN